MIEAILALCLLIPLLYCISDNDDPSPLWALGWFIVWGYMGLVLAGGFIGGLVLAATWVLSNVITVLWGASLYLVGALVWATIEWVLVNRTQIKLFHANDAVWRGKYAKGDTGYSTYESYVRNIYNFPPAIGTYRYKFFTWMLWWPVCIIAKVLNVRKILTVLFDWMANFWVNLQRKLWEKTGLYHTTEKTDAPST